MIDKPEIKIIATEIATKKKGYIIVERSSMEQLEKLLSEATKMLKAMGAKYIYVKFNDERIKVINDEIVAGYFIYRKSHELHILEYDLTKHKNRKSMDIKISPITIDGGEKFLQIYNTAFHDVPNSATYNEEDLKRILTNEDFSGYFILYKDEIVGILEMNYKDEAPELASIGIKNNYENKGIGRAVIEEVLKMEKEKGMKKVTIMVANNNEKAYKLYESIGFTYKLTEGKFFSTIL